MKFAESWPTHRSRSCKPSCATPTTSAEPPSPKQKEGNAMGGKFKTKSISTDALFERQIAEVDDAFSSNGRSFFHGCSDEIRTVFGWFHAFIFGGESLEQFTKAMQSISTVKSCQFPLPSAGAGALKIG